MCGIAAILYKEGTGSLGKSMTAMLSALQHRDPDSTGYSLYGNRQLDGYIIWIKLKEFQRHFLEYPEFFSQSQILTYFLEFVSKNLKTRPCLPAVRVCDHAHSGNLPLT